MSTVLPASQRFRLQALVCAALLIVCVLIIHPVAETGMYDDWSYIRSAQVLAQTGHFGFNGWATAMLGWQLLPAALVIKLFGFSFTAVRLSTLLVAAPMTFLVHRCMVRCGIREWNATIGTLLFMLSPLVIPAVTLYISDIWGFFPIVFCLYCLLRALGAGTDRAAIAWIYAAALGSALTGTARQTGFLGAFVMVPCALWLFRSRLRVLWAGVIACAMGYAIAFGAVLWFAHQPYSVAYGLSFSGLKSFLHFPSYFFRPTLELALLLCPLMMMFLPIVRQANRKVQAAALLICLALIALALYVHHIHTLTHWLIPFDTELGSMFSKNGSFVMWPIRGIQPQVIPESIRFLFAAATFLGLLAWLVSLTIKSSREEIALAETHSISWQALGVLTLPFCLAYIFLLTPSMIRNVLIDRYLIPLAFMGTLLLLRYYQERVRPVLPFYLLPVALAIAAYSVAATHDSFAMYRAVLTSANELRAAGVPRDDIDAGWEYNGWTQILEGGYVHQRGVRVPGGLNTQVPYSHKACYFVIASLLPNVHPRYALSFDPSDCGGRAPFAPIVYHRWLGPHTMTIYIVNDPPGDAPEPDFNNIQ